jgi:hypothetical protein
MTVYKVVRESQDNPGMYFSALVGGQALMTYQIDEPAVVPEWLASKGYYTTAFDDLQAAQHFADVVHVPTDVLRPRIFEAEGEELVTMLPPRASIFHVVQGFLDPQPALDWPARTVMVKSLRLTHEIK